jgi:membrane-associated protease RseP (regulator of RpoE activity)
VDILGYVAGVLFMVVGIAVSIGLHELGHFLPARRFGLTVPHFMIGFGPTLWSIHRGGTEYGVKAIPLGGYVSIPGMYLPDSRPPRWWGARLFRRSIQDARDASAESIAQGTVPFYSLPVRQRIVVMLGGPVTNLIIGAVLSAVVLMGFGTYQPTTTVQSLAECVLPSDTTQTECTSTDPVAPAAAAGMLPGDVITAIDGVSTPDWIDVTSTIRDSAGVPLDFTVLRDGRTLHLTVTPLEIERGQIDEQGEIVVDSDGNPVMVQAGYVGIGPERVRTTRTLGDTAVYIGDSIAGVATMIVNLPDRVDDIWNASFGGEERDPNGPLSVVGVGRVAGEMASLTDVAVGDRIVGLVSLLASLNLALFVFNLIPLLPLDGGHVAAAVWESVRRRFAALRGKPDPGPVDTARLIPVTLVVTVLLLSLSLLLVYADIVNPISLL